MPATTHRPMPDTYFKLVRRFPLVRIANDDALTTALAIVDDLLTLDLDVGEEAYLDALSALIHAYESEHHPIPDATPAEVLRELAEANGLTGATIAQRSGIVPSTVSALMSGKRRPTPEQMTTLASVFNVSPAVFLPEAKAARQEEPRGAAQTTAERSRPATREMRMAAEKPMLVDVVVKVRVADHEPQTRHGEARLEDEAVDAVADCLSKEKSVEFVEAALLGFEHCKWVQELGQPVDCGLPMPVRLHTDGSWRYPFEGEGKHSGREFASLVAFIWRQLSVGGLAEPGAAPGRGGR